MSASSDLFVKQTKEVAAQIHRNAIEKGWWEEPRTDGELIALCHAELSEALEAVRKHNPHSSKIQGFSALEEELADTVIRILDWAAGKELRIAEAIIAKMNYNRHREYRHGGKAL